MKNLHSDLDIRILRMKAIIGAWLNLITAPKMPILWIIRPKNFWFSQRLWCVRLAGFGSYSARSERYWRQKTVVSGHAEYIGETATAHAHDWNEYRIKTDWWWSATPEKNDAARKWLKAWRKICPVRNRRSITPSQMLRASEKKSSAAPVQEEAIPQEVQQQIIGEYDSAL